MKRFVKVFEEEDWVDTQAEHNNFGRNYFIETAEADNEMVYYSDKEGTTTLVGTLQKQADSFVVRFVVYTQYYGGECGEEEEHEFEREDYEKALKCANKDKVGWLGSFVEVYINDIFYRDYEVEE